MRLAERERYRLHARLPGFRRRVAEAHERVREALAAMPGEWGVGVSGGKDSVALAHLAHAARWRGRLFHFRFEETPPENTALVYLVGERLGAEVVDALVPGDFTTFADVGHFFAVPETPEEVAAVARGERRYKAAVEAAAVAAGFAGLFWGMRRQESRARAITLAKLGPLYRAASRATWTCCPLERWSSADVWGYLLAHDLPWLPVYDADTGRGRERERSETTWLGFAELWRHGQGRRLRQRDPQLWLRLCQRWPDLARWG